MGKTKGRTVRGAARAERRRQMREEQTPVSVERSVRGRRFTDEQREHALTLVASGGMSREHIAELIGTTTESLRHWTKQAMAKGTMPVVPQRAPAPTTSNTVAKAQLVDKMPSNARSPYAPRDPGQGLSDAEVAAIVELKQRHPSMGPAQIHAQLKRFKGWRVARKAIARVLRRHGYEPVHRGSRPQGPEPQRFEAPRPNALWQMDFTALRIEGEHFHLLVIQDDFSRFVVGHRTCAECSAAVVIELLSQAIARYGKPETIRTDRGGAFTGTELSDYCDRELIDHIVGHSYHPQGGGKVESVMGTVKRELWDVEHFDNRARAEQRLTEFFFAFNEQRAHMGIDGLTPADRYFGRADRVLATINALSRHRHAALAEQQRTGASTEEVLSPKSGAPMEVLRLMIVDGTLELRFCGARFSLGTVSTC